MPKQPDAPCFMTGVMTSKCTCCTCLNGSVQPVNDAVLILQVPTGENIRKAIELLKRAQVEVFENERKQS